MHLVLSACVYFPFHFSIMLSHSQGGSSPELKLMRLPLLTIQISFLHSVPSDTLVQQHKIC
jgi:hypothetical protein